jgi:hypothetical protein
MAPAELPYTVSMASLMPSTFNAAVAPALTHPRIPPPSIANAILCVSYRFPGLLSRRHRSNTACTTGWCGLTSVTLPTT